MNQQTLTFTTPRHHLSHRDGPITERDALIKVDVASDEEAVFYLISRAGDRGCTAKEAMRALGKPGLHHVSGRFTSLSKGDHPRIKPNGEVREGCRVMVCAELTAKD